MRKAQCVCGKTADQLVNTDERRLYWCESCGSYSLKRFTDHSGKFEWVKPKSYKKATSTKKK